MDASVMTCLSGQVSGPRGALAQSGGTRSGGTSPDLRPWTGATSVVVLVFDFLPLRSGASAVLSVETSRLGGDYNPLSVCQLQALKLPDGLTAERCSRVSHSHDSLRAEKLPRAQLSAAGTALDVTLRACDRVLFLRVYLPYLLTASSDCSVCPVKQARDRAVTRKRVEREPPRETETAQKN